ncbi:MAG: sodium:solute symporter family transporter [Planctomycetota bacterium]
MNAIVVVAYLAAMVVLGVYLSRYVKKDEDFTLAGRSLNHWVIAGTIMATNVAAIYLIGPAGAAYAGGGAAVLLIAWTGNMIAAVSALFVVPRLRRLRITTVSEFLETRYGVGLRLLPAALWIVYYALFAGNAIYTLSVVLNPVLDIPEWSIILVVGGGVIVYCFFSGLVAAAYSSVIQSFLIVIGGLILLPICMREVGGVLAFAEQAPLVHKDVFRFWRAGGAWPIWKDVVMFTILGLPYWCTSQYMLQRAFAGRSVRDASKGLILAALLTGPLTLTYIIPGICGSILYADNAAVAKVLEGNSDLVIPTLLTGFLTVGLAGLIIAALAAASNSTAAALLNSLATLSEHDFYKRFIPKKSPQHYLWVGRVATLVGGLIGIGFAFYIKIRGLGIIIANFKIMVLFEPPVFVAVAAALFWKRVNAIGAALAVVGGILFVGTSFFFEGFTDGDRGMWVLPVCFILLVVGTLIGNRVRPTSAETREKLDELASRMRGPKPDYGSRRGQIGVAVAGVSLVAFVLCSIFDASMPKPANILILMGLMMGFVLGCLLAVPMFVPDEREGVEGEEGAIRASLTHKIVGNGWVWLGIYVLAAILVVTLYFA